MLFNNMAYLPVKSGRQPNIERLLDVAKGKVVVAVSEDFYRPTDVVNLWGDPTKAKNELGCNPMTKSFEQLFELMVKHDMAKVKTDAGARTNLAEFLEEGNGNNGERQ